MGGGTEHFGVWLTTGAEISAGGVGTVTVEGTGGTDGQINYGVFVREVSSRITSNGGAVSVTGQGGGAGAATNNIGVNLINSGQIGAGGAGTTTVLGTGGATTGAGNVGVSINSAAQIFSTNGAISVTGVGTATSTALFVGGTSTIVSGNNAAITITADSVNLAVNGLVNAGTGAATIEPRTAGTLINLGGADVLNSSPLTLGLTDTELDQVTAGTLVIGNATSGVMTVSVNSTRPANTAVELISGNDVVLSGGQVDTGGGTLLLDPGPSPAAVKPTRAATDATASTVSFGSDLNININGATVDAQYTQLNVAGTVNLTGVDLVLTGPFVPAGNTFTIVSASSVTGAFNGLANGSTFLFNGRMLQIDYTATTVTLTDVTPSYLITTAANPLAGGTVSCTLNPVPHGGSSTCTATLNPGYSFVDWSGDCTGATCVLTNVTSAKSVTANFTVATTKTFTGPTATGTGNATAAVTGGGNTCGFVPTPQFIAVASVPAPPPAGYTFPHGLFSFTLTNCPPGGTVTLTMTYPNPLPPGTQYWKFGPEPPPGDASPHWYVLPANIAGNTATFTITDGGLGDDDLVADGDIVDQGGPGVLADGAGGATGIPTLHEWALLLFGALFGGLLWRTRRRVG